MTDYSPLELSLPERTGQETVEQRLTALEETVPRLLEALQYTLSNLGAENFNSAALSRLLSPIRARIDGADGSIAQLNLDADALQTRLTSAEGSVAALEQTVSDQGARIALVTNADGVNAAAIVAERREQHRALGRQDRPQRHHDRRRHAAHRLEGRS